MKKYKTKGKRPKTCGWCGKSFGSTRLIEVHARQVGDKNCIKPTQT